MGVKGPFELGDVVVKKAGGEPKRVVTIDIEYEVIGTVTERNYVAERYAAQILEKWSLFRRVV